ncbi:hypothetical protein Acidovoranil_16670 [Acidovorax sp. FG27]
MADAAVKPELGIVDYTKDTAKQADLDAFVRALAAAPGNESKPSRWFLEEAHKRVVALHVIPTTKAAPADVKRNPSDEECCLIRLGYAAAVGTTVPAEVAAWMNPATGDVIHANRKADWLEHFGLGGRAKAEEYTMPLYEAAQDESAEVTSEGVRQSSEGSALKIARVANADGGAMCVLPLQVETPAGWVGAYDLKALKTLIDAPAVNGVLRAHAEGRIAHNYAGHCPDQPEGPDARDPACKVCAALRATPAVQAPPATSGSYTPWPRSLLACRAATTTRKCCCSTRWRNSLTPPRQSSKARQRTAVCQMRSTRNCLMPAASCRSLDSTIPFSTPTKCGHSRMRRAWPRSGSAA